MGFQWAGAAAGANDALQQLIARRLEEQLTQARLEAQQQQMAQQASQFDTSMGQRQREFAAEREDVTATRARQAQQDQFAAADRDIAAADRRQVQNKAGVRSLILEGMRAKTTDPRTAQLMAAGEGVDLEMDVLDPEKAQRDRLEQIQEQGRQTRMSRESTGGSSEQVWVIRGGKPTPIPKGTAQPGDQPYDPVAARNTGVDDPQSEALDTAKEVKRIAGALRTHPGLNGAFGVVSSRMPTVMQRTADAETLLNSLQGLLTIENMGKMKGVLSDADMRILRQASTTLDAKMSEPAARAELTRLEQVMSKLVGDSPTDNTDDALLDELLNGGR